MNKNKLLLKQVSEKLKPWGGLVQALRPTKGWIHTIRQALGMTTTQLAKRLGINQSRVVQIEQAEANDAITLRTLRAAAEALNCQLVYAIVPSDSLEKILEDQAKQIAQKYLDQVSHSMLLEQQSLTPEQQKEQLNELVQELLQAKASKLWNE